MDYKNHLGKRQKLELIRSQLENERSTFISHWRDLSDYILPRRSRFYTSDVNKGDRRNQRIIDSTATLAARTLRSGMMSGITSPARPWFKLTTPDPDLAEYATVKDWLHKVQRIMSTSFLKSNLYNVLPVLYGDLGTFGTSPIIIEEEFSGNVFHCESFPVGSYMISKNRWGVVDTFVRDFRLTVRQVVEHFGYDKDAKQIDWSNMSDQVKNLWDQGQTEQWIEITHIIKPNEDYDKKKLESRFKKYVSCYYEKGYGGNSTSGYDMSEGKILKESGYDYFPVLCPRWEVTGEDVYGTSCPGMDALGDIKQLQLLEKRSLEAIEKMIRPPMIAPVALKNQSMSILPGDVTYADVRDGMQGIRPAHEINYRIQEAEMKNDQVRQRIRRAYFEDLFLMLANSDRRQITAREIDERHEEKLLALGPVLEQLNQDLLDPLIDLTFDIHLKQGMLPEIPDELRGIELKIEYISVMAEAQKLIGISGLERFTSYAGQVAQFDPSVLLKIKSENLIDTYADVVSIPPTILRTDEEVQAIKAAQAKAQQEQMMMEQLKAGAGVAKDLGSIPSESGLGEMLKQGNAGRLA
jgi:hypothetical protein